jgi:hypothetical protein
MIPVLNALFIRSFDGRSIQTVVGPLKERIGMGSIHGDLRLFGMELMDVGFKTLVDILIMSPTLYACALNDAHLGDCPRADCPVVLWPWLISLSV